MPGIRDPAFFKLGTFVAVGAGHTVRSDMIDQDAWSLELEDIEKETGLLIKRLTIGERGVKSPKTRFLRGDVLYGKLRPYLNKVLIADEDGYCTTEIVPLRTPKELVPKYLYYWLQHPEFRQYATQASHGMNMPRLGPDKLKDAPVALTPLRIQERVVAHLDGVYSRIDFISTTLKSIATDLRMCWDQICTLTLKEGGMG